MHITTLLPQQTIAKPTTDSANTTINKMITAQELRIGNLVKPIKPRHNEKFIKVESIDYDLINIRFRPYEINEVEPIALTEELLIELGFEKQGNSFRLNEYEYFLNGVFNDWERGYTINENVIYVNRLQNLFWVLTGKELTINKV